VEPGDARKKKARAIEDLGNTLRSERTVASKPLGENRGGRGGGAREGRHRKGKFRGRKKGKGPMFYPKKKEKKTTYIVHVGSTGARRTP